MHSCVQELKVVHDTVLHALQVCIFALTQCLIYIYIYGTQCSARAYTEPGVRNL